MHMPHSKVRFAGFELYFDDLERARRFYTMKLGLRTIEHDPTHHVKLAGGDAFLCLERKGMESYPSAEKAVVFVEVPDLQATVAKFGSSEILGRGLKAEQPWTAIRDPEGHTVLLLQKR
jgi:catechol 2,3-dioxygenase-like lactoylglutathione lyase family enzyme